MIVVDGVLISVSPEGKSSPLGREILASLLELPALISAAERLKATPQWKFSVSDEQSPPLKLVYVFQHEYATVDPNLVHVCLVFSLLLLLIHLAKHQNGYLFLCIPSFLCFPIPLFLLLNFWMLCNCFFCLITTNYLIIIKTGFFFF